VKHLPAMLAAREKFAEKERLAAGQKRFTYAKVTRPFPFSTERAIHFARPEAGAPNRDQGRARRNAPAIAPAAQMLISP